MNLPEFANLPRLLFIKKGDHVLYQEDVFFQHQKSRVFVGQRTVAGVIIGQGIPGNLVVEIIRCKGVNAFPIGVKIERPMQNLLRGFLINDFKDQITFKSGGHLAGVDENGKAVALTSADRGGMSVGATHANGGIKGDVGGKSIEFENKEAIITSEVNNDNDSYDFNGKQMSAREVLSEINVNNGGKSFADGGQPGTESKPVGFKGGEIILTAPVTDDQREYDFNGKKMKAIDIASEINQKNKGVKITAKDGTVVDCPCNH